MFTIYCFIVIIVMAILYCQISQVVSARKLSFLQTLSDNHRKNKKKLRFGRNFIRPYDYSNTNKFVFANKFCILSFYTYRFEYYIKEFNEGHSFIIVDNGAYEMFFTEICKQFNFSTSLNDIEEIIQACMPGIIITGFPLTYKENENLKKLSVNNMSIAEMISLPGMNMGKANKVFRFLENNEFHSFDEFLTFVDASEENAKELTSLLAESQNFQQIGEIKTDIPE